MVVRTDAVKGQLVELSMGPSAVSNRTYNFDRVFSQAADQNMVFDDTVKPILDEVSLVTRQTLDDTITNDSRCSLVTTAQSSHMVKRAQAKHTPCLVI